MRAWLARNHAKAGELWIGFHKKSSRKAGTSYAEALCHGWIDAVRYAVDALSCKIRFTPGKQGSIWSLTNGRHVERLSRLGKMAEPGKRACPARGGHRTGVYSFEQKRPGLAARHKKIFREDPAA